MSLYFNPVVAIDNLLLTLDPLPTVILVFTIVTLLAISITAGVATVYRRLNG